jgi:hypothetical protein
MKKIFRNILLAIMAAIMQSRPFWGTRFKVNGCYIEWMDDYIVVLKGQPWSSALYWGESIHEAYEAALKGKQ